MIDLWPSGFSRIPDGDPWVTSDVATLARKYDTVENHGWYRNLEPTLDELQDFLAAGDIMIDYSAGTGILVDRLLRRCPDLQAGYVLVDASPKFLRLALDKLGGDERTAYRWLRFLKNEHRLQRLDEVLLPGLGAGSAAAVCSTNAIHLYYDLPDTLRSWYQFLRPGGRVFVQSGNIANPNAADDWWIIDATVEQLQDHAIELVRRKPAYAEFRPALDDTEHRAAYADLRRKYFLPVRPLSEYVDQLRAAGLEIVRITEQPIEARVDDWYDFLSAYHDGVLGWAGGTQKIAGHVPSEDAVQLRLQLLRESLGALFHGQTQFKACWTYMTCENRAIRRIRREPESGYPQARRIRPHLHPRNSRREHKQGPEV